MRFYKTFGDLHLDGEGNLILTKNETCIKFEQSQHLTIENFHFIGCNKKKLIVLWTVAKWVFRK